MYLERADVEKFLQTQKKLSRDLVDKLYAQADKQHTRIEHVLIEEGLASEESLYIFYSDLIGIPFIDLKRQKISKDTLLAIPEAIAKKHRLISFHKEPHLIKIAMEDPEDLQTIDFIKKQLGTQVEVYLTTPSDLKKNMESYRQGLRKELQKIVVAENIANAEISEDLKKAAKDLPIIKIVDTFMEYAIHKQASDIHIEPAEKEVYVRNRIDGILQDVVTLPKNTFSGIIARVKILANLKIDEHRLPQDGRFKIEREDYRFSVRVSVIPVYDGEKIVMRLLKESDSIFTLEELGFHGKALADIQKSINRPHGMILATGPTGSGKTTTLYSILHMLNTTDVNVTTIEDPIEYRLARVNQSQVVPQLGFTFASGLRSILRQDPDIVMVGEIRDEETADISIRAAMTGHLVLSTLHTNDAAGTLPRLMDMQVKPFLIASTVNVIIAQRLVRKICQRCIYSYEVNRTTLKELSLEYNIKNIDDLIDLPQPSELKEGKTIEKTKKETMTFYKGKGCDQCGQSGYKGRMGIYEVLDVNKSIQDLIMQRVSADSMQAQAIKDGMLTMFHDGIVKARQGITTIEEILRVTKD